MFVDICNWGDDKVDFVQTGPFLLWLGLICAQTAVWAVGVPVLKQIQADLGHAGDLKIWKPASVMFAIVLGGALVGAIVPDLLGWDSYGYLHGRPWKISLLGLLGALVAVYGLFGMWRIYAELRQQSDELVGLRYLPTYLKLHDKLQQLITLLGGALGLVILAAAAERNAVQTWGEQHVCPHPGLADRVLSALGGSGGGGCETNFPSQFVLIYGFYFTALLAYAYAPVSLALIDVGRKIRASAAPVTKLKAADVVSWQAKRSALDDVLDLKVGTATSFRTALAILTPVLGSLTSLLFGSGA